MDALYAIVAAGAAIVAAASRALMKRRLRRWTGKVVAALLEVDFWKAAAVRPAARLLLVAELASWAALLASVLVLASGALGSSP
jgi:hypothetical protein